MKRLLVTGSVFFFIFSISCQGQHHFRPPAYPLITVDPYFSIWSFHDTLNNASTVHWTGRDNSLVGLIRVDGLTYCFLGLAPNPQIQKAKQISVRVTATRTIYHFKCGMVNLTWTFTAPLLPGRLDLFSRPADYLSWQISAADHAIHKVQLYFSAAGNIPVNTPDQVITWKKENTPWLQVVRAGTESQHILGRKGDNVRIDWGWLYLAVPSANHAVTTVFENDRAEQAFAGSGTLPSQMDSDTPRAADDRPAVLCTSLDPGAVGRVVRTGHLILAYDDLYSIEYFHRWLRPWWRRVPGMTALRMLDDAEKDYGQVRQDCQQFDSGLYREAEQTGGRKYAEICSLAFRQAMAAHKLVAGPRGHPLLFNKECFSNGSIGTVDVTYPSSPVFLRYNPVLLEALMTPIFHYSESGLWKKPIAAHDVGTYPIADGQTYPEDMPVEECGNMIILTAAITRATHSTAFAILHWKTLSLWARYLETQGFDPANQLCTDDFAGHLAHNANLSIKAILALACYGRMATLTGHPDTGQKYTDLARADARRWMQKDLDSDHYSLTFDRKGTWSQKYNLVWDRILDLHIFPSGVARTEVSYYLTKQHTYGLPLDSRKTYTKSDWILWVSALADSPDAFHALVNPVWKYIDETPSRVPISDWHDTVTGRQVGFQARSVVGGYFMPLLYAYWHNHRNFTSP